MLIIRIDDRLIHGQVIVGWVKALDLDNIIVANDDLLKDKLKLEMMKLAVPSDINIEFLTMKEAVSGCKNNKWKAYETILLVESPKDAYNLVSKGCSVKSINVGGLHMKDGREPVTDNLALNDKDRDYLKRLIELDLYLEGRALPSDREYRIEKILKKS